MPSTFDHRPEMAMDGQAGTSYLTYGGMGSGDDFVVILSTPIPVRSIKVTTGANGENLLTDGFLETSADGATYKAAADFGPDGTVNAQRIRGNVKSFRIRVKRRRGVSHLQVDEISVDSKIPITHVEQGPPRGFVDISQAPDLADWAARAEAQMEAFWPDIDALLYTDKFIPPNAVNVIYTTGPRVTPVAATGGGVMTVNSAYARKHADDTGLTVHETAHVVQSGGGPGWLIEAIADYVRWIKFEPQNFTFRINPKTATPHDPYRTGAAFLGWCELHYDSRLVTKLNEATRFGNYQDGLFEQYCGKPIGELWKEFMETYQNDRAHLFDKPLPPAMQPRELPTVGGSGTSVDLPFDQIGIVADGSKFGENAGFDGGGAAYPASGLKSPVSVHGVSFTLKAAGQKNILVSRGQEIPLSGSHKSLWILGGSVDGPYRNQVLIVNYADGTSAKFYQNFSDWYQPMDFPGEVVAVKTSYRDMSDGSKDNRPFNAYAYGFPLDPARGLKSIVLPGEEGIRILSMELAD
ncbi:MAG TPA: basic secretory protein-like protein [Fimbriimonas sp.]|nr:basic secretory protein-like protein [Fimbriimonas sp.]